MSSGVSRIFNGSFVGATGVVQQIRVVPFRPRRVEFYNVTGLVSAVWTATMADGSMAKRVTTGALTAPTSNGITPQDGGFDVGADNDLNADNEIVHFTAYE